MRSNLLVLREDAAVKSIAESGRLLEATDTSAPTRRKIQIITPGWGSSGYYSPEVLERAATEKVIPAGTHMYLNHASESEHRDRPERDVEKIAAVLVEDATWDGTRLLADADLMGPHAELIEALAPYIGVSIDGAATDISIGEAEGRTGPIIEGLAYVSSVDFVTHAGRGGMVLLEAARPSMVNHRAIGHGVTEATVNDTREQLQNLLRDAFGGEKSWIWVRDFDETTVWYEHETPDASGTFAMAYEVADDVASLSGTPTEVRAQTTYVPVTRPDSTTTTQESKEDTMPQIEEARLRQLEQDAGRVPELTESAATAQRERDEARAENAQLRAREGARDRARSRVTEANTQLPATTVDRIVTQVMAGDLPLTEAGALDEAAFDKRVDDSRAAEEKYLTGLAEATGTTGLKGFGESAPPDAGDVVESARTKNPWGRDLTEKKGA